MEKINKEYFKKYFKGSCRELSKSRKENVAVIERLVLEETKDEYIRLLENVIMENNIKSAKKIMGEYYEFLIDYNESPAVKEE